jgi:hypothetical protein
MKDLNQIIKTTLQEFLNENSEFREKKIQTRIYQLSW